MKKFPVKIDLSAFFQDERKFILILVDPEWKSIENLQQRVEQIFDVRPVHFLTSDGLFIPPQESVEVVEYTESLKAYIPQHAVEESRRRSKQFAKPEIKGNTDLPITEEPLKIKRKYYTLGTVGLSSSTPNHKKKSRRTPIEITDSLEPTGKATTNESQEITSTNDQVSMVKSLEEQQPMDTDDKANASIESLVVDSDNLQNQCTKGEGLERNSVNKKKRKRIRKESSTLERISKDKAEQSVNSMTIGPEVPSSTLLSNSKSMDANSHIYFDDSTIVEAKNNTTENIKNTKSSPLQEPKQSPKIVFKCKLTEKKIGKPLAFPLKVINKNRKRKPLIDIKENILLPPANTEGLIKESTKQNLNIELEKSISAEKVLPKTLVGESKDSLENMNAIEPVEKKSESITSETISNSEVSNELNENSKNELTNTAHLEDSTIRNNASEEIENNTQEENTNKSAESNDKADDKLADQIDGSPKEAENANNTKTELSAHDVCNLDITNKEASKLKSKNCEDENSIKSNTMGDLESSSAIDESCVIDLDDEDDDEDEDVIDLSDENPTDRSTRNHSKKLSETLNKSITKMSVNDMLPFCTPLIGTPKVGDIVVFKFNREVLGDKLDVSEFIACKCEHVNRRTKVLKLAIIDSSQEKNIIPHQFVYKLDESLNTDQYMNIRVTELIDPKVLEI